MFFKITITLISVLLWGTIFAAADTYEGYKVYDVHPKDSKEKEIINNFAENAEYDFFALPKTLAEAARVMVPPKNQNVFEHTLSASNIEFAVVEENVGRRADIQRAQNQVSRSYFNITDRESIFARFQRHNEINAYLEELAETYSNRVKVKTLGTSHEGRSLKVITISNGDGRSNKKVILLDAGIHAREWIAPAAALYVIYQLVENLKENKQLLKKYDWVILPAVNPDGYEYTHTKARMWRKTRKPVNDICIGTDGNRNFDFQWGQIGASRWSCAETYLGKHAFSEPETRVLRDLMLSLSDRAKMYLTLHSYGKYLLYPWSYTTDLPANWQDMDEVARAGVYAIWSATGTRYELGSTANILYAAGCSGDYALAVAKIPISIAMVLPGGGAGFDPSPDQIWPFVTETWVGIKAMTEVVISKY